LVELFPDCFERFASVKRDGRNQLADLAHAASQMDFKLPKPIRFFFGIDATLLQTRERGACFLAVLLQDAQSLFVLLALELFPAGALPRLPQIRKRARLADRILFLCEARFQLGKFVLGTRRQGENQREQKCERQTEN
jgi:hypothetical protein